MRIVATLALALTACPGGTDEPDETDTTAATPTFAADITPLFQRNCASGGCHGGPEGQTGLDLSDGVAYGDLVDVAAFQAPALKLVEPGNAADSYLMHKLLGTQEDVGGGGDIMPPGFGLAQSDIDVFAAWIDAGAAND